MLSKVNKKAIIASIICFSLAQPCYAKEQRKSQGMKPPHGGRSTSQGMQHPRGEQGSPQGMKPPRDGQGGPQNMHPPHDGSYE